MAKSKKKQPKPVKSSVIRLIEFSSRHFRGKVYNTDMYYVGVANTIYPIIKNMVGKNNRFKDTAVRDLVLNLTCYVEDLVSKTGVWEAFVSLHSKKYGREMPFYDTDDEFYSREFPCVQAVQFIIWYTFNSYSSDTFLNPQNPFTALMALSLTPYITEAYDNAPDTFARPMIVSEEEFGVPVYYQIRNLCLWLCGSCYLTRILDINSISEQLDFLASKFFDKSADPSYLKDAYIPFNAKIGPLGIRAQEWLAEIMEIAHDESEEKYIPIIKDLKSLPYSVYRYEDLRKDGADLIGLDGCRKELSAYTMPDCEMPAGLNIGESALISLVHFDGKWVLNGLGIQGLPDEFYQEARTNWIENMNNIKNTYNSVFKFLKKKKLGVCAGYVEYLDMFPGIDREQYMNVPDEIKNCKNLFYFLNDDSDVTFLPNWGSCVKLRGNKFYDKKEAENEAICLILDHSLGTREMREYLIDNNLIPDAALNSLESVKVGKKLFQENIRFLNDYMDHDTMEVFSKDMINADKK